MKAYLKSFLNDAVKKKEEPPEGPEIHPLARETPPFMPGMDSACSHFSLVWLLSLAGLYIMCKWISSAPIAFGSTLLPSSGTY